MMVLHYDDASRMDGPSRGTASRAAERGPIRVPRLVVTGRRVGAGGVPSGMVGDDI